jgi:hypothetical protein
MLRVLIVFNVSSIFIHINRNAFASKKMDGNHHVFANSRLGSERPLDSRWAIPGVESC